MFFLNSKQTHLLFAIRVVQFISAFNLLLRIVEYHNNGPNVVFEYIDSIYMPL